MFDLTKSKFKNFYFSSSKGSLNIEKALKQKSSIKKYYEKFGIFDNFGVENVEMRLIKRKMKKVNKECKVIIGFPDQTLVPSKVSQIIIELLDLPMIGMINSELFSPGLISVNNGEIKYPIRIYGKKDIIVITTNLYFKENHSKVIESVYKLIMNFCLTFKAKNIFSISSEDNNEKNNSTCKFDNDYHPTFQNNNKNNKNNKKDEKINFFCASKINFLTSNKALAEKMEKMQFKLIKKKDFRQISALLVRDFQFYKEDSPEVTILTSAGCLSKGWAVACLAKSIFSLIGINDVSFGEIKSGERIEKLFFEKDEMGEEENESIGRFYV